jgi:hypothetical protein
MPRLLTIGLSILGLLIAGSTGYLLGGQNAKDAYGDHFMSEAFTREYHEARNDLGIVSLLAEKKIEGAFQAAQSRYYSRLILAAEIAAQSSNPNLQKMLQESMSEAREFQAAYPYQFPTERDQKKWAALLKSLQ